MNSPSATPLCDLFKIDADEIRLRKQLIGFTDQDTENLEAIRSILNIEIDGIIEDFYAQLAGFDELKRFLSDQRTLGRLKETQRHYLLSLGVDIDKPEYFERRLRIGLTHERVGLKQKWYMGSYGILFRIVADTLTRHYAYRTKELAGLLYTLHKIVTLDSTLAVETYYQATTQRLENILTELSDAKHNLEEISRLDGLTQVNNRKFATEALEVELYRSLRFHHSFSVLFVDIDDFKAINDQYGHPFGDFVLQRTAQLLRGALRPSDILGRFGGEEFVAGLVETDGETAHEIAERLRLKIALTPYALEDRTVSITVSIGLASLTGGCDKLECLLEQSDAALYEAKHGGKNQTRVFTPPAPPLYLAGIDTQGSWASCEPPL